MSTARAVAGVLCSACATTIDRQIDAEIEAVHAIQADAIRLTAEQHRINAEAATLRLAITTRTHRVHELERLYGRERCGLPGCSCNADRSGDRHG